MHAKNKLHDSFFLRYYILKNPAIWLADSILAHCQLWDWLWNIILDYFQEILMIKFFKKSKKPYFKLLLPKSGHKWIFPEKVLCRFLDIPIIYHLATNQTTIETFLWRTSKCRTDELTDGRTDRLTDKRWLYRTLRRTGVQ